MSSLSKRLRSMRDTDALNAQQFEEFEAALRVFCREWSTKIALRTNGSVGGATVLSGLTVLLAECGVVAKIGPQVVEELQRTVRELEESGELNPPAREPRRG